jgi:ketosteroid isomerase-like protein
MAEHKNAALIRSGYDAFAKGDMDTINDIFADDIVWHIAGRSSLAGDYKGKQEVFTFFGQLAERSGGTFSIDLHDVIGNDEHVTALTRERGERDDKRLDVNGVHVWHVRGGKAVEFWGVPYDVYAEDEFWGS